MKKFLPLLLLFIISASFGCGKGDSGAKLFVTTSTVLSPPASKPVSSKALLAAVGDGTGDTFEDQLVTPSAVTLGLRSFRFIKKADPANPTQTPESYIILDADPTSPHVIQFQTNATKEVAETVSDPRAGTYDRVEYELTYVEMVVPLCGENNACENRRIRYYLTSIADPEIKLTTAPLEILVANSENSLDFAWVSPLIGLPASLTQFPIAGARPSGNDEPIKITSPVTPLNTANPALFSLKLPSDLEVPRKPKGKYLFTLHFDLSNLFFFDNTDGGTAIDPSEPFHFNALVSDVLTSQDGKVRASCSTPCPTSADFSPGLPDVTITVVQEETD